MSVPFAVTWRVDIPILQFVVAKDGALRRVLKGANCLPHSVLCLYQDCSEDGLGG